MEAAMCLIQGIWRIHWWGWEVCLGRNCADIIANQLIGWNGGGILLDAGKTLLNQGWQAALKSVVASALIVMFIYAFGLGWLIKWRNGPNGVCIQGNWPTPWVGAYVWAVRQ